MSVLDEIRDVITDVFSDEELFFYPVSIYRAEHAGDNPFRDDGMQPSERRAMGLETTLTDRQRERIPDADSKILILKETLSGELRKGDVIDIPGRGSRVVLHVQIDPAGAVWTAFGRAPDGSH